MTMYTVTSHSGLGFTAVESCPVVGAAQERAVAKAGGVLLESYRAAEYVCEALLVYPHPAAIAPCGVRGEFSSVRLGGLAVWVPDLWARTMLVVAANNGYSLPTATLQDVVAAVGRDAERDAAAVA